MIDLTFRSRLALAGALWCVVASPCFAEANAQIDQKADQLLQEMSRSLAAPSSLQVEAHAIARMQMKGMFQEMSTSYSIALARPNRLAVRSDSSYLGSTIVTDGTTLTRYNTSNKTYKSELAPPELQPVFDGSAGGVTGIMRDPMAFIGELLGKSPYEAIMHGVTAARYVSQETVAGAPAEHLQLQQDDLKYDFWLTAGDNPMPLRIVVDLTSIMVAGAATNDDRRFTGEITFASWNLSPSLAADAFAFVPPAGAKVEQPTPQRVDLSMKLLTKPAPDFKLPLLGGGEATMASLKGKVVVLDFWATWCGPCRMALPIVSSTAIALKGSGVEFFAVNLKEGSDDIREFLKQAKLDIPVALDKEGEVGNLYKVEGIPQTVLIGKDGTVQVVHVGFGPDMKAELKKEIEDLAAGKVLATTATIAAAGKSGEPKAPDAPDDKATPDVKKTAKAPDSQTSRGVELAWSVEGPWTAVTTDGTAIFAANLKGEGVQLSAKGEHTAQFKLPSSVSTLRAVRAGGKTSLLGYQSWGRSLASFDTAGKELWSAPIAEGISEVMAADLDGDGTDEVVVAANGSPGVQVLKSDGRAGWKAEKLAKVAHVDASEFSGDKQMHVIATGTDGKIHDFSSTGGELRKIDPKVFATLVRSTRGTSPTLLLAAGTTKNGEGIAAVDTDGKARWSTPLSSNSRAAVDSAELSPDSSKIAVAMRGSAVHILDVPSGNVLATIAAQGLRPEIAWLGGSDPLLLIATGTELNAVRLTGAK